MLIHDVNKQLVDLRYSEFDDSGMEELESKKKKIEVSKKVDGEALAKINREIRELKDETEEEKRAGRAKFKKKTRIDYKGTNRRPPYHFTWVRYTPTNDYREFNQWITGYDYTPVKYGKDPFYPVGAKVNQSNYWQFHDLVWVKRDLKAYLLEKVDEKKRQLGGKSVIDRLENQFDKEDQYLASKQWNTAEDMQKQIEENGYEVGDDVLKTLGL